MYDSGEMAELRTFVAVADAGSFSAAAALLQRDATALSRRLQSLEKRLGVRLAERNTRSFQLSEAGTTYLERIRPFLLGVDNANREAAAYASGEPRGKLRVTMPGSFARLWLAPLVTSFMRHHPEVTLDAHYSNDLADIIGQGFDLAIRLGELEDSTLIARKVADRRRLLCASPDYLANHPILQDPRDISKHRCLCFTGQKDPYRWEFEREDGEITLIPANCYMSSDDSEILVEAALSGLGILQTYDWHVAADLASGALVEVLRDWPLRDAGAIYIVTPTSGAMPSKTRAFSDWIASGLAKAPWREVMKAALA